MSNTVSNGMDREDIEMLLPWFITGKLPADEREQVEAYLAAHPDMRRQLDLIEAERADTIVDNEAMGAPSADALHRLMGSIDATSLSRRSGFAKLSDLVQNGLDWLGSRSALVPVAAAACVALALQAGIIGLLWHSQAGAKKGFDTASAPSATVAQTGTFVVAGFVSTATLQQIEHTLTPLGITISDGPKPGGIYRLKLSDKPLGNADRDLLITAMASNTDVIRFVAAAGP